MTMYSVWSYDRQMYDFYDGAGPGGTHAGAPPMRTHGELGATPEEAGWIIPMGAKKVGSGPLPQGRIATFGGGGGLGGIPASTMKFGVLGLVAYLAWRALR